MSSGRVLVCAPGGEGGGGAWVRDVIVLWAQTKMSWRGLLTSQYSRQPLGIKAQSRPAPR